MSKVPGIRSTLPNNPPPPAKMALVQALVDDRIVRQAKAQMAKDRVSWRDLLTSALKTYLAESSRPRGSQ